MTSPGTTLLGRLAPDQVAALEALRWLVDAVAGRPARPQEPVAGAASRCMVRR